MPVCKEIADFVQEIDDNFVRAKENRVSRMDITWGVWSRDLNLRMKKMQKDSTDPNKSLLVWCFMYWVNRSELLELNFKYKLIKERAKRELVVAGAKIKNIILSGDPVGPPGAEEQIKELLHQVGAAFNKQDDTVN